MSTKSLSHNGYPRVCIDGKWRKLHRVTYCKHHGLTLDDIQGQVVRHTCDTPNCINPEHLVIGTNADNMQDKVDRDRQSKVLTLNMPNSRTMMFYSLNHTLLKVVALQVIGLWLGSLEYPYSLLQVS